MTLDSTPITSASYSRPDQSKDLTSTAALNELLQEANQAADQTQERAQKRPKTDSFSSTDVTSQSSNRPSLTDEEREAVEQELKQVAETMGVPPEQALEDPCVLQRAFLLHQDFYKRLKEDILKQAVEVEDRKNKIKFIHTIMQDINNYMDDQHTLDLTQHPELQEKLKAAKEMGVNIFADQVKFTSFQTTRLIDNLNTTLENWDTDNRTQLITIERIFKESEHTLLLLKAFLSMNERTNRTIAAGIRGG